MKACLIVIDVQESFRHRPYFTESGTAAYLGRIGKREKIGR